MTDKVRAAAVALMTAATEEGRAIAEGGGTLAGLEAAERARALRLAVEALRWAPRADRLLGPHLRLRPEDVVMNALRLAIYEMHEAGVPPHGAVNAAVAIVPKSKAGLVNAVLRNVGRRGTDWASLPVPGVPKWLRKPLVAAWGKAAVGAMEAVHAAGAPLDLTVKGDAARWADRLNGEVLPTGSVRIKDAGQVSAMPGFEAGEWWVQDAAAALPARMLGNVTGERVLDLCAAPGGKTMQLAAAGAKVTALDVSEARLGRLRENLARTALKAEIVLADALTWTPETPFDAILLDAPCSATGTLRRHPDLGYVRDLTALEILVPLQAAMLDRALGWLKPGGRLVYCTCSLLPDEGEAQRDAVLARSPQLSVGEMHPEGVPAEWVAPGGGLRLRPDYWAERGGIDGFYMVLLQKPA
jgi:16S rRNA (cytosine967-C5)-methyltransferase